jgi:uncharacterized membrane protein
MPAAADQSVRTGMRLILAAFYSGIGVWHFVATGEMARIVPDWMPYPYWTVIATGCCEIAGAAGLLLARWRRLAGLLLALYVVCVFPANIKWIVEGIPFYGHVPGWDVQGPRLVLQFVLIWWALFCVGWIDWPFRRMATRRGA